MPVVPSADFKRAIRLLSDKEKESLLLRAVRRDAELYDAVCFELLPDVTLETVQAEAEDRIHELFNVSVSGYLLHKSLPKVLSKAQKEVARARRVADSLSADGLRDRVRGWQAGARVFADEVHQGRAERETELREQLGLRPTDHHAGTPELPMKENEN